MNSFPQKNDLPVDLLGELAPAKQSGFMHRWYTLTSLPDTPDDTSFLAREAVRRSRLTSSVMLFFLALLLGLMPVTLLVIGIYPSYFWLTLALFAICLIALVVNRAGYTNTAGFIVAFGAFAVLTTALFTTVPFDETTLQGYDMYVILLLLCVALLPIQWLPVFFTLSVGAIISTLFMMAKTPTLQADVQSRVVLILARPIGILFMGGGIAWILSGLLTSAIRRANRAEMIAKLENDKNQLRQNLEEGMEQILQTHVEVSNGNLSARAPLSDDSVLWQIARSLNVLLVRFQRAVQAEQELQTVDQTVTDLVAHIQRSERNGTVHLPLVRNVHLGRLLAALQGKMIEMDRSHVTSDLPPAGTMDRSRNTPASPSTSGGGEMPPYSR